MINCYEINEYLYCPRRYYYIKNIGLSPDNEHIEIGRQLHKNTAAREFNNLFFRDEQLGLKGRIDYLTTKDKLILFELKKGKSKTLWHNDRLQLLSYWLLAKRNNFKISKGIVKYNEGKKFEINFLKKDEKILNNTIKEMKDLDELPPRCNNQNKCNGCNLKQYCWI